MIQTLLILIIFPTFVFSWTYSEWDETNAMYVISQIPLDVTRVTIKYTDITSFPAGSFDEFQNLTFLSLYLNQELSSLPSGIFMNQRKLEEIRVTDSKLTSLPEDFFTNCKLLVKID